MQSTKNVLYRTVSFRLKTVFFNFAGIQPLTSSLRQLNDSFIKWRWDTTAHDPVPFA